MYFKRLEIIGFKSFAEKTKLHFEPGVTAIVGPNGCGKSNIADAIKWAFGEQAPKSLRASRMEDVIFNGTDKKEPINLAEVSITFDNQSKILPIEYDEVTFTRRLFRSGESEYLLNKMPVRLRDIQELLMGTGIGTESYSMIEQGQIDLILSSKPEERRYIFEEASGITRYKSKRKEALSKLEQTENNITRLNDIISEVKRQITSIERQARKAERYKQEFEKLKDLDTRFSYFNYKNVRNKEKISSVEMEDLKSKCTELTNRIARFNEIAEKLRADSESISENYSQKHARSVETVSSLDKAAHKMVMNKERIKELEQSRLLLEGEIQRTDERRASMEQSLADLRQRVDSFLEEKNAKETIINQMEEQYTTLLSDVDSHQKDIATSKTQTVESMARQSKLNNEIMRLSAEVQSRSSRLRRLNVENSKVTEESNSLRTEFDRIDSEVRNLEAHIERLNHERAQRHNDFTQRTERLNSLRAESEKYQKEVSLLTSRLRFLEELVMNYEGFDKGVRSILEAQKNGLFTDIKGPLCTMIDVESGFEGVVELALDRQLQSFLVNSRGQAREMLSYLQRGDLGRIMVMVKEELPHAGTASLVSEPFLRPLFEVIRVKDEYKDLLRYLLRDTYFTHDQQKAQEAIRRLRPGARIFTKEGECIQQGTISGGAKKGTETSLVGRERKIQETRLVIAEYNKNVTQLHEIMQKEQFVLDSVGKDANTLNERIREEERSQTNIATKRETVEMQLRRLEDERLVLTSETDELKELLDEFNRRLQDFKKDLKDVEEKKVHLESVITESQQAIEHKSKQREELLVELTRHKTELASLSRGETGFLGGLKREENMFEELASSVASKKQQITDGMQRIAELEDENITLETQKVTDVSEKERLEQELTVIREQKTQCAVRLSDEEHKAQRERKSLEQLRENLHQIEVKKAELSYKQSSLRERMRQAYKIDLDQLQMQLDDRSNWEEVQSQIEELQARLERMGTVNLVAIEEHQELQERFNFLTHQQQDLLNAKDSLLKAIQKINKTTRSLFIDTFTKIQEEFRNFFRLLFGGGQAELLLLDERDILESGIEIIVRPPGKKLQNISLLSGGEKALTAISLLFAIFKVKPSPFCILDEIDAPLDESNIGRFSNVLRDFLKISQFIIITHNKKTIELADVMYGITMEESGVSKIVSVKFSDTKKPVEEVAVVERQAAREVEAMDEQATSGVQRHIEEETEGSEIPT
jgi:chromosome segregation protein